jgi:hypothetical protein
MCSLGLRRSGTTELLAPVPLNLLASAAHLPGGGTSC